MRSVAYDNGIDFRLVSVFLVELLFGYLHEAITQILLHKVYGAAAEASAHDARAGDTAFFGNIIEEVKFLTANSIVL